MKKRIYGLETEYGVALIHNDGRWTCEGTSLSSHFAYLTQSCGGSQFLANGSRIYIDMVSHPEYCTAECLDPLDLVANDKAGEKILDKIFNKGAEQYPGRIHLFKSNVQYAEGEETEDGRPVTFGCHENFSMDKRLGTNELAPVLIPFLVARQVFAGSGWVANFDFQTNANIKYTISQRERFIGVRISNATHGGWDRAILCTARWDEPLADAVKYKRLHLLIGDSNMSELSTYLKMAAIGILLEMIEENYPLVATAEDLMPRDPVRALHLVSWDLTCRKPVIELINGKMFSAINMLEAYAEMIGDYEKAGGMDQELSNAFAIFKDVLRRLEKREIDRETLMEINSQGLNEELDWLIKKSLLEYSLQEFGCGWRDFYRKKIQSHEGEISIYDHLRFNDLKYHDISDSGLYNYHTSLPDLPPSELKQAQINTPRMVEKEKIESMEKNPPQNTRAKIRGEFVRFLEEKNLKDKFGINWNEIRPHSWLLRLPEQSVCLDDPFATRNKALEEIKRALA